MQGPPWPGVPPEIPRPGRPGGTPPFPGGTPQPAGLDPWLRERLFDQRIVMVQGLLTPDAASSVAAQLVALETMGSGPVTMHIACPDGDLGGVFALIDTLDLMRVTVSAVVTGGIGGAALGVLAAADRRSAYPHARFRLMEPRVDEVSGTADEVVGQASRHLRMLEDLILLLAEVTGKSRSVIESDLSDGRLLSAEQAREYGLIENVVGSRPTSD